MNKKERVQLDQLVKRVRKTVDLIHTPGWDDLADLEKLTPIEIMQEVISQLNHCDIYLRYSRFDQEASVRDLENLLSIIHSLGGEKP